MHHLTLEDLFLDAADTVYSFLLSRCGNVSVAEDLTATTFEMAGQRFAAGRGEEVSVGWLITVARRRLIDHWRREASRGRSIDRLKRTVVHPVAVDEVRDTTVDEALASLPVRYRAALALRYVEDLAISEVADALDLSYKATESLLARARSAFSTAYRSLQ